ncbi:hypothetical protein DIPPA_06425 [Diplonema papillatum]|nr:hypothetical protein DIPPA_06425 [Diplonema papillatum]
MSEGISDGKTPNEQCLEGFEDVVSRARRDSGESAVSRSPRAAQGGPITVDIPLTNFIRHDLHPLCFTLRPSVDRAASAPDLVVSCNGREALCSKIVLLDIQQPVEIKHPPLRVLKVHPGGFAGVLPRDDGPGHSPLSQSLWLLSDLANTARISHNIPVVLLGSRARSKSNSRSCTPRANSAASSPQRRSYSPARGSAAASGTPPPVWQQLYEHAAVIEDKKRALCVARAIDKEHRVATIAAFRANRVDVRSTRNPDRDRNILEECGLAWTRDRKHRLQALQMEKRLAVIVLDKLTNEPVEDEQGNLLLSFDRPVDDSEAAAPAEIRTRHLEYWPPALVHKVNSDTRSEKDFFVKLHNFHAKKEPKGKKDPSLKELVKGIHHGSNPYNHMEADPTMSTKAVEELKARREKEKAAGVPMKFV